MISIQGFAARLTGAPLDGGTAPTLAFLAVMTSRASACAMRWKGPEAAEFLQRCCRRRVRGRQLRGVAVDAEGSCDCAAGGLAAGRGRLSAAHRAGARRDGAGAPDADADRRQVRDRARGAHLDDRLRRRGGGFRRAITACPLSRCSMPARGLAARRRRWTAGILARTPRWGARDRRARSCRPRRGSTSARSRSRRAATRARSRSRVFAIAATRTGRSCARPSTGREAARLTRSSTRARASAGSRASCPRIALAYVRVEVADGAAVEVGGRADHSYTDAPRARSSGDRALPCGGRGRKFESCRAHPEVRRRVRRAQPRGR